MFRGLDSVPGLCLFMDVLAFRKPNDTDNSMKVPKATLLHKPWYQFLHTAGGQAETLVSVWGE